MSRLSGLDANRYLRIAALLLVVLTCANLLFCAMRYELGWEPVSFFGTGPKGPTDRLADLVKDTFSYRAAVQDIKIQNVNAWPKIFKNYYLSPYYAGKEGLTTGHLTHFHQPPLTTLYFLISAFFIVLTQSPVLDILLFYGLYLASVQWAIWVGIPRERRRAGILCFLWLCAVLSFPALNLVARGNFQSGIASMMILAFLLSLFLRNRLGLAALISLAIAVNFRPNAVIFVLAIPVVLGFKRSLKPVFSFAVLSLAMFASTYFAVNRLYPDYTISAFLRGLEIYKNLYVIGRFGDGGNASLWALVKNYSLISLNEPNLMFRLSSVLLLVALFAGWRRLMRLTTVAPIVLILFYAQWVALTMANPLSQAYFVFSVMVVAAAAWGLWSCSNRAIFGPFLLSSVYCLLCPVFAEYHLLVFLAPLLMLYFCDGCEWKENYRPMTAIAVASLLMLAPKNYFYIAGLSLQTLINPLIVYCATMYVAVEARQMRIGAARDTSEAGPVPVFEEEPVAP